MTRLALALTLLAAPALAQQENPMQPSDLWESLRYDVIQQDVDPPDDPAQLLVEAPFRADNPALVPVRIHQPAGATPIEKLVVVVDGNPAPVVATFTFGPALAPLDFEFRSRVDAYSNLRAIATLADGRQVMAGRYVRASGGCAAPAGKSMADLMQQMGQMRVRQDADGARVATTVMIRHPNFSGLQRDQVTLLNIPAHFIDSMTVTQGDAPLFTMEGGISVSEDPVFRFLQTPLQGSVNVHAEDTDGNVFDGSFPAGG